jgi:hypothetical protein
MPDKSRPSPAMATVNATREHMVTENAKMNARIAAFAPTERSRLIRGVGWCLSTR